MEQQERCNTSNNPTILLDDKPYILDHASNSTASYAGSK